MALAERRIAELIERWQASLDLHARYLKLDAAAYARAEAWPKHQRPNAWVIELAGKRLHELRTLLEQRAGAKDDGFAEALELMSFLTNLLGSENIERFIPLATGKPPDTGVSATVEQPRVRNASKATAASRGASTSASGRQTVARQLTAPTSKRTAAPALPGPARAPAASTSRTSSSTSARPATPSPSPSAPPKDPMSRQVIADAVRMLEWGKEWPAIAGLIARMADRPTESGIWTILRAHRQQILTKARRPAD